jgi:hypothetical protein
VKSSTIICHFHEVRIPLPSEETSKIDVQMNIDDADKVILIILDENLFVCILQLL